MIKLITFDLDDTLWDNTPVIKKAVAKCYQWLFERCPDLAGHFSPGSLTQLKDQLMESDYKLACRVSEVRILAMEKALLQAGYRNNDARSIAEQAFDVFHHWRHQVELFPGTEAMLAELAEQFDLGVITNGNADVNRMGLGDYFRFNLNAEILSSRKPDPVVFHHITQSAGIRPEQVIHIGDSASADVKGAADVGMKTIWFNPSEQPWEDDSCVPDQVVSVIPEIPAAINSILQK